MRSRDALVKNPARLRERDLDVVARMATRYLLSGGFRLAAALFEGLVEVRPDRAYFLLGLGVSYDRLEQLDEAERCFIRAIEVEPAEGRGYVNLAELALARRQRQRASRLLREGIRRAHEQRDEALEAKARAMMDRLGRTTGTPRP